MSGMSRVGPIIGDLKVVPQRFPFFAWAVEGHFQYPKAAHHLFCMTQSAAEAFMLRALVTMPGTEIEPTCVRLGAIQITPQHRADRFSIDFGIVAGDVLLAVEIDGREFHRETHEQIQADYERQRHLTRAGYSVVRFTAVETFHNPSACWLEVLGILQARGVQR